MFPSEIIRAYCCYDILLYNAVFIDLNKIKFYMQVIIFFLYKIQLLDNVAVGIFQFDSSG